MLGNNFLLIGTCVSNFSIINIKFHNYYSVIIEVENTDQVEKIQVFFDKSNYIPMNKKIIGKKAVIRGKLISKILRLYDNTWIRTAFVLGEDIVLINHGLIKEKKLSIANE